MNGNLKYRLDKVHQALYPEHNEEKILLAFNHHDAESNIRGAKTAAKVIAEYLEHHPEDAGRAFRVLTVSWIAPTKQEPLHGTQ